MHALRTPLSLALVVLVSAAAVGVAVGISGDAKESATPTQKPIVAADDGDVVDLLRGMVGLDVAGKVPGTTYRGDDSCIHANDLECDDPRIGTGACRAGTDYSDCWRIAEGQEDDSCRWANDGECDEPNLGFGVCTQGTDRSDCGDISYLRFQDDTCATAFDGVCDELPAGNGTCQERTDRADCLGRERPLEIADHFFGFDDRVILDTASFPWSVIGSIVSEADGASCTATLVAENVLITAAHCIEVDDRTDARARFETAFDRRGRPLSAEVTAYLVSPGRMADLRSDDDTRSDWALLRIDRPLGADLGYVGVRSIGLNYTDEQASLLRLYQAGYSWDTGVRLSGDLECSILSLSKSGVISHDCDTTHGDSGSPLMIAEDDRFFIIGTDSAFDHVPLEPAVYIAAPSDAWALLIDDFAAGLIGTEIDVRLRK